MFQCVYYLCQKVFDTKPERCPECGCATILKMCDVCGSTNLAESGWCIACRYGDKPYH